MQQVTAPHSAAMVVCIQVIGALCWAKSAASWLKTPPTCLHLAAMQRRQCSVAVEPTMEAVRARQAPAVATSTINQPQAHNAVDAELAARKRDLGDASEPRGGMSAAHRRCSRRSRSGVTGTHCIFWSSSNAGQAHCVAAAAAGAAVSG
jgi:hypothetical protein